MPQTDFVAFTNNQFNNDVYRLYAKKFTCLSESKAQEMWNKFRETENFSIFVHDARMGKFYVLNQDGDRILDLDPLDSVENKPSSKHPLKDKVTHFLQIKGDPTADLKLVIFDYLTEFAEIKISEKFILKVDKSSMHLFDFLETFVSETAVSHPEIFKTLNKKILIPNCWIKNPNLSSILQTVE